MDKLSKDKITSHLKKLKGWELKAKAIEKKFVFKDFNEAFAFISRIALLSEKMGHHPDWSGVYNKVAIKLSTHDAGGVTKKDIDMAKEIESYL